MFHLLIVPSWYPTETKPLAGSFFKEQAEALRRYGWKVSVVYPEIVTEKSVRLKEQIVVETINGVKTYRIRRTASWVNYPYIQKQLFYTGILKLYRRVLEQGEKPDFIHAHACFLGGWAGARLATKTGLPFILTEHASKVGRNQLNAYQRLTLKQTLRKAKKVIAVSPSLAETLNRYSSKSKVTVIPNMINTDYFRPSPNTKKKKFRFLSVASLKYGKGMDLLIAAFSRAFPSNNNVELFIGGDGPEKKKLIQQVKTLGVGDRVKFLGALGRKEVKREMQKAHSFVLASRFETFGVVYAEALACGLPIIATACGGPEMIVQEKNGFLVPVEDVAALSEALKKMYAQYEAFDSEEIRADCLRRFSEKAVVSRLRTVYESCLSPGMLGGDLK